MNLKEDGLDLNLKPVSLDKISLKNSSSILMSIYIEPKNKEIGPISLKGKLYHDMIITKDNITMMLF